MVLINFASLISAPVQWYSKRSKIPGTNLSIFWSHHMQSLFPRHINTYVNYQSNTCYKALPTWSSTSSCPLWIRNSCLKALTPQGPILRRVNIHRAYSHGLFSSQSVRVLRKKDPGFTLSAAQEKTSLKPKQASLSSSISRAIKRKHPSLLFLL